MTEPEIVLDVDILQKGARTKRTWKASDPLGYARLLTLTCLMQDIKPTRQGITTYLRKEFGDAVDGIKPLAITHAMQAAQRAHKEGTVPAHVKPLNIRIKS